MAPFLPLILGASPPLKCLMPKERSYDFKHFLYYIFVTFETFQDAILGADLVTPLWGHSAKKCKTHLVESIFLSNFCSFACRFQDIIGQIFVIMAPTIPYYLTNDLNNDMIRLISTIETILRLYVYTNIYQKNVIAILNYRLYRWPWDSQAYFLISIDRTW